VAQALEMVFKNEGQKNFSISLNDPRADLTPAEVKTAMETVLEKNIFKTGGGDVIEVTSARIVDKTITELELV
jgi:hypothetical protein